ncbi:hypothetical protein Q1695_015209 [Nippostrongylus brasiliensis]|nr:hypothetical protein Q1695_015209 [Nippostrongylus brasiliensis]
MNSILGKIKKKETRDNRRASNGLDRVVIPDYLCPPQEMDMSLKDRTIAIRQSCTLAQNIDALLRDSWGMAFFKQFLESCDKINLVNFWSHVDGFKASFGRECSGPAEKAEKSLALLDAQNIYSKYIDTYSASTISLPKKISERVFDNLTEDNISPDIFDEAKNFIHSLFELRYFDDFESSVFYKKYQFHVFSQCCSLEDILYFVDDRHDHDCLQFLIACNTFELNYDSLLDEESVEDAMSIYDKYFSMQALSPIDIGDALRRSMESEICSVDGRPSRTSFSTAKQFCFLRIRERYIEKFIASPGYLNYLLELEADVRNAIELPKPDRERKCAGSSSSDSQPFLFDRHFDGVESRRSSTKLPLPSPLPSRTNRRLNLAEVDCMGRYHVLYDDSLSQDKTTPSRIRQTLRKYLDKTTLKEEEVAVEVARTIIADVHSMVEAGRR